MGGREGVASPKMDACGEATTLCVSEKEKNSWRRLFFKSFNRPILPGEIEADSCQRERVEWREREREREQFLSEKQ